MWVCEDVILGMGCWWVDAWVCVCGGVCVEGGRVWMCVVCVYGWYLKVRVCGYGCQCVGVGGHGVGVGVGAGGGCWGECVCVCVSVSWFAFGCVWGRGIWGLSWVWVCGGIHGGVWEGVCVGWLWLCVGV